MTKNYLGLAMLIGIILVFVALNLISKAAADSGNVVLALVAFLAIFGFFGLIARRR